MYLIVGLGNPDSHYAQTRHNAGFMVVERLARRHNLVQPRMRFHSGVLEGIIAGEKCMLMQPVTYMNRSGLAVGEAATFYKLPPSQILIIVDDVALPCGRIRLRGDGSPGGHNGLADIQRALGTQAYPRLRIGIDPPGVVPQVDYVLGRFRQDQLEKLEPALDAASDAVEYWIAHGLDKTMTKFNARE